jgi:hypothetical protein
MKIRLKPSTFLIDLGPSDDHFTLNGRKIPFVNHVNYLGVILDKRITWKLHLEMVEAKAFRTFIRIYSLLRSNRLSANIKLILHKASLQLSDRNIDLVLSPSSVLYSKTVSRNITLTLTLT